MYRTHNVDSLHACSALCMLLIIAQLLYISLSCIAACLKSAKLHIRSGFYTILYGMYIELLYLVVAAQRYWSVSIPHATYT